MSPVKKTKSNFLKDWNWRRTASAAIVGLVLGTLSVLVYDKYRVHEVVCQVVGADEQSAVIAARCMIK